MNQIYSQINNEKSWPGFNELLLGSGVLAAYFGALIFVIGWSYMQSYFGTLGITYSGSGGSGYSSDYAAYAFSAIRHYLLYILIAMSLLFIVAMFFVGLSLRFGLKLSSSFQAIVSIFVLSIFIVMSFAGALWVGQTYGREQIADLILNEKFPSVILNIDKNNPFAGDSRRLAEKECLRKVFIDSKYIYVYPAYERLLKDGIIPPIYSIALDSVSSIELSLQKKKCTP
jgi:hypothetical protein